MKLKRELLILSRQPNLRPMLHDPSSVPNSWYQNLVPQTLLVCHAFWYQLWADNLGVGLCGDVPWIQEPFHFHFEC